MTETTNDELLFLARDEVEPVLRHFSFSPGSVGKSFASLAVEIVRTLPRCEERSIALRKLLEAKDAAGRART